MEEAPDIAQLEPGAASEDGLGVGSESGVDSEVGVIEPVTEGTPTPIHHEEKESFASKLSYILVLVGYAVGFGNIWRFPYLMQENGGVVFLFPFIFCMIFLGIPVFFLELAIGQRLRKSALHAWNEVSPYLAGVGVAAGGACLIVGYYYTTLIAWCMYYFFSSFQNPLPWRDCDIAEPSCCKNPNSSECKSCMKTGSSSHFWYEIVIKTSESINDPGKFNWGVAGSLFLAWFLTWGILVRGIKASGQVAYVTALLPYVVLSIFLVRGLLLEGMEVGYEVVFSPNWDKLWDVKIWFAAGSQVFFNFGLGFGLLVSFSALLPANNNCYRDCLSVALINFATSLLAASVVFPTLGYKGTRQFNECVNEYQNITYEQYKVKKHLNITGNPNNLTLKWTKDKRILAWHFPNDDLSLDNEKKYVCDLLKSVQVSASGTGMIFIAYAEAISKFESSQFWAILFFVMILTLGIDSGFTTVEGAIIMIRDWNFFNLNLKKWKITTGLCLFLWLLSFLFAFGWGEYMLTFIDEFTTNWTLFIVGFCECVGVAWVYGLKRFSYDIKLMTGSKPNLFMLLCWRFFSPLIMVVLFTAQLIDYFTKKDSLQYKAYNHSAGEKVSTQWPTHAVGIGFVILVIAVGAVPLFAILAKFGIRIIKDQPPADFPEEELRAERFITEEYDNRPLTLMEKILYWGSNTDIRKQPPTSEMGNYDSSPGSESYAYDSVSLAASSEPASPAPEQEV